MKGLFPKLCERADEFIAKLRCLADGKTKVPLKKHIYDASMGVISKVS